MMQAEIVEVIARVVFEVIKILSPSEKERVLRRVRVMEKEYEKKKRKYDAAVASGDIAAINAIGAELLP